MNRWPMKRWNIWIGMAIVILALLAGSCLPKSISDSGGLNITLYGFSIMKEPLEKAIYPAFAAKWKQEHGQEVNFVSSFAGSETVTNQILQGVKADMAILSIDRDAQRLRQGGFVTTDWHTYPHKGIVNKTPFVILVRKGNPKNIHDFPDLARSGTKVIHPDPISSGGAQWSILAIYGSELKKSEVKSGQPDKAKAVHMLQAIWKNVISTPGSAREARTQFETGSGDALITYELEGLSMKEAGGSVDLVIPEATIFSEHPAVIVDKNVGASNRPMVDAFLQYLWSDEAQQAFVKFHFRSVTNEEFNKANKEFAEIKMPFTVDYFGGWDTAYPEVIEGVFKLQVQKTK
jgi:sulfate/thiosulfate transport system substrate-binding protein